MPVFQTGCCEFDSRLLLKFALVDQLVKSPASQVGVHGSNPCLGTISPGSEIKRFCYHRFSRTTAVIVDSCIEGYTRKFFGT